MRASKRHITLPIGRAARLAFDIDTMRAECCKAAKAMLAQKNVDEEEVEECARLDEALDKAHRIMKHAIREIMLSRISRGSRGNRGKRAKS